MRCDLGSVGVSLSPLWRLQSTLPKSQPIVRIDREKTFQERQRWRLGARGVRGLVR